MCKNDVKITQLDNYQSPQISVIILHADQTILNVSPTDFDPGFGFGEGGEIPLD